MGYIEFEHYLEKNQERLIEMFLDIHDDEFVQYCKRMYRLYDREEMMKNDIVREKINWRTKYEAGKILSLNWSRIIYLANIKDRTEIEQTEYNFRMSLQNDYPFARTDEEIKKIIEAVLSIDLKNKIKERSEEY